MQTKRAIFQTRNAELYFKNVKLIILYHKNERLRVRSSTISRCRNFEHYNITFIKYSDFTREIVVTNILILYSSKECEIKAIFRDFF